MSIKERITKIKDEIKKTAVKANRDPESIKLIAVTKKHTASEVDTAIQNGIEFIGENRVQEASTKLPEIKEAFKEFHFIGHLQSNKINKLLPLKPFLIHSIDKFSTAKKLNKKMIRDNGEQKILIQVNTSGEDAKDGCKPEKTLDLIKKISELPAIKIEGLMTISKLNADDEGRRKCFIKLRELFEEVKKNEIDNVDMKYLSMGMSNDFKIAIQEGSNLLRIGTAIMSPRSY